MLDTLRIFFSSSITNLSVYDILVLVLFVLALILTIVFSIILVAAKVRQLDNDVSSRIDENIELDKTILNYLDTISHNLSKKPENSSFATPNENLSINPNNKQKQLAEQIGDITNLENQNNAPIVPTANKLADSTTANLPPSLPVPATEQDITSLQKATTTPKTILAANPLPQLQEKDSTRNSSPIIEDNLNSKKLFDELARLEQKILQQQEETRKLQTLDRERLLKQQYLGNVDSTLANTNSAIPNSNTIYNPNSYNKKFDEVTLNVLDTKASNNQLGNNNQQNYENNSFDDFDDDYIDDLPLATTSSERNQREHTERRHHREERDHDRRRNRDFDDRDRSRDRDRDKDRDRDRESNRREDRVTRARSHDREGRQESPSYARENNRGNAPQTTRAHRIDTSRPYDRNATNENTQGNQRYGGQRGNSNNRYSATPRRASYDNVYGDNTYRNASNNTNLEQGNYAGNPSINNNRYAPLGNNNPLPLNYGRENTANNYYRQPNNYNNSYNNYAPTNPNRLNSNYTNNTMANNNPYATNSGNMAPMQTSNALPRRYPTVNTAQPNPLSSSSLGRTIPPRNTSSIGNMYNRTSGTSNLGGSNTGVNNRRSSNFGARY